MSDSILTKSKDAVVDALAAATEAMGVGQSILSVFALWTDGARAREGLERPVG